MDKKQEKRSILQMLKSLGKTRFSIMIIPHSDQKVVNLKVGGTWAGLLSIAFFALLALFIYSVTVYSGNQQEISKKNQSLLVSNAVLEQVIKETNELERTYQGWNTSLGRTLQELGIELKSSRDAKTSEGDLASLSNVQELSSNEIREIFEIKSLSRSLAQSLAPLEQISQVLATQKRLLSDIPNLWPVSGGNASVAMEFGPNRHPVSDNWFIHKGIDINGPFALTVVASANGKVIEASYDANQEFGAYIVIEHKYGFRTRYSHLGSFLVKPGDEVYQGQRIGTMGTTGLSTGFHVDFQIMIGTQILDPSSFLKVSTTDPSTLKVESP